MQLAMNEDDGVGQQLGGQSDSVNNGRKGKGPLKRS
jgi:hypothetical protein